MTDEKQNTGAQLIEKLMNRAKDAVTDFDPQSEAKKAVAKGATTTLVVLSLLSGMAFSGPSDITQEEVSSQLRKRAPKSAWSRDSGRRCSLFPHL